MCQDGTMSPEVEKAFIDSIKYLEDKNVSGISSDCGLMLKFQDLARKYTTKPVFLSPLAQLSAVTCGFSKTDKIIIMTADY